MGQSVGQCDRPVYSPGIARDPRSFGRFVLRGVTIALALLLLLLIVVFSLYQYS